MQHLNSKNTRISSQSAVLAQMSLLVLMALWVSWGCDDDPECKYKRDCASTEICQKGECVPFSPDSSSVTESDSDSSSDSSTALPPDTQTDTDSTSELGQCLKNDDCSDGNPCTADFCNFTAVPYFCDTEAYAEGAPCDDSDPCNGRDVCQNHVCMHQTSPCADLPAASGCGVNVAACNADGTSDLCTYSFQPYAEATVCMSNTPCIQGQCQSGSCAQTANVCGEAVNSCKLFFCEATGDGFESYECSEWTNETDTECL